MKGYPHGFLRALVAVMLAAFVTGLGLAPTTLALRFELIPDGWRLPGGWRILCAALHVTATLALLAMAGSLWSIHMRAGWRRHTRRRSGGLLVALLVALAITAVVVFYASEESAGAWAAGLHLGLGLAVTGPLAWHWVAAEQARRRHAEAARAGAAPDGPASGDSAPGRTRTAP